MNNREQYKRMLNFLANAVILFFQGMCFAYIWYEYYSRVIFMPFFRRGNWAVVGMYVLILFFFTRVMGGYKVGYLRISDICLSQLLAILASNVIGYLQICMIGRDYMPIGPIIMITWAEILFVVPWAYTVRWLFVRLYPPRKMLIIYGKYSPDDLIKKVNSRRDKYNICGAESIAIGYEELTKRIPDYEAVVLCDLPAHTRNKILKFCFEKSIRIYVTPKLSDIIISGSESIHLFDTPLYLCRNNGFSMDQRIFKRAMDIIGSLIGIIILSPFMLLTAAAIKAYDRGPVFFKQARLTQDGREFGIIKFRSMCIESEKNGAQLAKKHDDRITPVGRLIRKIHFDEIPQLFNILKGDMSIVGPRPERQEIASQYEEIIPEFRYRLKVKAGLTGYAQVYGKYNTTPYDKLKLDMLYIENYSFWLDIKILLMTFKVILQKENSEGIDENQITALKREIESKTTTKY